MPSRKAERNRAACAAITPSDVQQFNNQDFKAVVSHLSRQDYFLWAEDDSNSHILIKIGTIKPTHQAQRMATQHRDFVARTATL